MKNLIKLLCIPCIFFSLNCFGQIVSDSIVLAPDTINRIDSISLRMPVDSIKKPMMDSTDVGLKDNSTLKEVGKNVKNDSAQTLNKEIPNTNNMGNTPETLIRWNLSSKLDSNIYTKYLNIFGGYSTITNDHNDSINFYKTGYTVGFNFGDFITKYLAYNFSLEYSAYSFDRSEYLYLYNRKYKNLQESIPELNGAGSSSEEKERLRNASTATAEEFISNTRNNLETVSVGLSLKFTPVKIGRFTPYLMGGGNFMFALSQVSFIEPAYDPTLNRIANKRLTYFNNSVDGSVTILSSLGCDFEINRKMNLFIDVKKTWSKAERSKNLGNMQWDVLSFRIGYGIKIK